MKLEIAQNSHAILETEFTPEEELAQSLAYSNARREERVDFRTTGLAYQLSDKGLDVVGTPVRVWTLDVSTIGCLMRSQKEFPEDRLLLRLFLPQLRETIIEAKVARKLKEKSRSLNGKEAESHLYGMEFINMLKLADLEAKLPHLPKESKADSGEADAEDQQAESATTPTIDIPQEKSEIDFRVVTVAALACATLLAVLAAYCF